MKSKSVLILTFLVSIALSFEGCSKYEEGPNLSFRSRKDRVSNNWKVSNYKINGIDSTFLVSAYTETFTKERAYNYTWGPLSGAGTWVFQNSDKEIKLNGPDAQTSRTLFIIKLEEKEFWYYYLVDGVKNEFHLNAL